MRIITQSAFAKINLGLRILSKRSDGYHEIETVFQRISLSDVVAVFPSRSGVSYTGDRVTDDPRNNLSVKAAAGFLKLYDIKEGVEISLTKRIPTGAGLGGGSSDAAAVIKIMADLFSIELTDHRLVALALEIGADVPFFLKNWSSAIGKGLGERLERTVELSEDRWILILWPGFQISTAQAYREFDNSLTEASIIANLRVRSLSVDSRPQEGHYSNDFESIAFSSHPTLLDARDKLLDAGALTAGLAGSGSSLFAIFDGESEARMAASIQRPPWQSYICRPC